jgi:hypothetical protein
MFAAPLAGEAADDGVHDGPTISRLARQRPQGPGPDSAALAAGKEQVPSCQA